MPTIDESDNKTPLVGTDKLPIGDGSGDPQHYNVNQIKDYTLISVSAAYVPVTRTVNGHALSGNISVTTTDLGLQNVENAAASALYTPLTRTVNGHALSSNVTVTATDVSLGNVENAAASALYVPLTRTINGNALNANVALTAASVGAPSGSGTSSGTNTGDQTNITGNAATATLAANVTTNANLTGPITSVGNATTIANSVALPGSPTTTTQAAADNSTKIATTAYADRMFSQVTLPTYSSSFQLTDRLPIYVSGVGKCTDPLTAIRTVVFGAVTATPVWTNTIPYNDSTSGISKVSFTNVFENILANVKITTAGNGIYIKEGTNACMGIATLVAGAVTVATTKVTTNSRIFLTRQTTAGTIGSSVDVTARVVGTSFTITSNGSVLDTSTVAWEIKEPA